MQCGDLERYLEAYLDGRLGRTRTGVLRRHLGMCPGCRLRLEKLRHFERDLNRRLRADTREPSVWEALNVDLVRTLPTASAEIALPLRLPAPIPVTVAVPLARPRAADPAPLDKAPHRRSRMAPRIVGAILIAAAVGVMAQSARLLSVPPEVGGGALEAHLEEVAALANPPLSTSDPVVLRAWFEAQTGIAFPALPQADGFGLLGGRIDHGEGQVRAVVVYKKGTDRALLQVQPSSGGPRPVEADEIGGLTTITWALQGFDYALRSAVPTSELTGFAHGQLDLAVPAN